MSRARARSGPTISLFPFLAVLLCTMGSLLVVLVIFSRSARKAGMEAAERVRAEAVAAAEARRGELESAREELGWRIGQVRGIRDRTADELARARMQLAGTEENARKLADELASLTRVVEGLDRDAGPADDEGRLLDLERRLAEARRGLDEAREAVAGSPPAYAVVPYEGPNGTRRRPLYIECCLDGVFLQPEGIRLGPADFEGPLGPGNPLASALRAAREHIARNPGESGDPDVQPYPLLLVRPSGVMAYYAARESIQSWGSEFGYQFIDEEWTLTYPPADPALAEAELRAVEEARRRLQWLAQVRPPKRARPAVQYRAATTRGGVVSSSGPSVLGDQSRFDWTEEQATAGGRGGQGRGFGGSGSGAGAGTGDAAGADTMTPSIPATGADDAGPPGSGGDAGAGSRYAGPSRFYADGPAAGPSGHGWSGDGDGASPAGRAGTSGGTTAGGGGDSVARAGAAASRSGAGGGSADGAARPGAGNARGGDGGGGGGGGPAMPGLPQGGGGASAAAAGAGSSAGMTASLAGRRGSNWASLATMETPVPLTRPIRVECAAGEFRIVGDAGRVQSRIPIGTHTVDAVDPLVAEVHATVRRWGLAGDRMYWRPQLVLSATPDGIGRREELESLLADSGIDTRRSETKEPIRKLPPVPRTGGLRSRR